MSDFYKYKANEDIIILYQSKDLYYMFPRRFFASEEDFKTFISYLEASLPTPKR
ncbi:MAG: YcxB family protein [Coleofasciculaceae cyanobacterium SM2_1_6]|nr:YcxB family protein [Coleofasciculaceae cyanobacterium SM2_1_6]